MTRHAVFYIARLTEDIVFIVDDYSSLCPTLTITNDAEWVVELLLETFGNKRFVYKDTEGQWDELKHDGVKFTGFAPYNGKVPNG